ncbi:hypothetical protein EMIT0P43_30085 [Pseudomonas jessenii]
MPYPAFSSSQVLKGKKESREQGNVSIVLKPVAASNAGSHWKLCFCLLSNNRAPFPFFCFKGGEIIFFGEPFEFYCFGHFFSALPRNPPPP